VVGTSFLKAAKMRSKPKTREAEIKMCYTLKKRSDFPFPSRGCHSPNYPWPRERNIELFLAMESLVSHIPAGDGKIANLFLQCK